MAIVTIIQQPLQTVTVTQQGDPGPAPELQVTATHIQWRTVGSSTWINLIALSELIGPVGLSGTITIGTVTTGAAGSSASVVNVGTPEAAILNITIPRGDKGEDGVTQDISGKVDKISGYGLQPLKYIELIYDDAENIPYATIEEWNAAYGNSFKELVINSATVYLYFDSLEYPLPTYENDLHLETLKSNGISQLENNHFKNSKLITLSITSGYCTLGSDYTDNGVFSGVTTLTSLTVPYNLSYADSGSPDGDLLYALANNPGLASIEYGAVTDTDQVYLLNIDITALELAPKVLTIKFLDDTTLQATGDGQVIFTVTEELDDMNLIGAVITVSTASTSGLPTYQLRNITQSNVDILSTLITLDVGEFDSYTALTQPVINPLYKLMTRGDRIAVDCDIAGTGTKGTAVVLTFQNA